MSNENLNNEARIGLSLLNVGLDGGKDDMKHVNEDVQEILADIFANSERPDKMKISMNKSTRSITVTYEDLDDEWFNELLDNGAA